MKNLILTVSVVLLSMFLFFACGKNNNSEETTKKSDTAGNTLKEEKKAVYSIPTGYYTGFYQKENEEFGSPQITFSIESIDDKSVKGSTICIGVVKPFEGIAIKDGENYKVTVNGNPLTGPTGEFAFTVNTPKGEIKGTWTDKKDGAKKFNYELQKRDFKYNPEENFKENFEGSLSVNASTIFLKKEDVANLMQIELTFLRNSIYARHRYAFKTEKVRAMFEGNELYMPLYSNVDNELTDIEKKNIELIKRYEAKNGPDPQYER